MIDGMDVRAEPLEVDPVRGPISGLWRSVQHRPFARNLMHHERAHLVDEMQRQPVLGFASQWVIRTRSQRRVT